MNSNNNTVKVNKKVLRLSGIVAVVMAACAIIIGILELVVLAVSSPVNFIKAGERWSASGEKYAVISLYTEADSALSADQIERYAMSMDSALTSASIDSSERGRVWTYCYLTEKLLSVKGPKSSGNANVIAFGGDFFVFHPLKFIYGTSFLNDASIPNGVVLDENLAWKIFGATDVVGMTMSIYDEEFTVVGITEAERGGDAYKYTYGETPRMYMSYNAYYKLNGQKDDITAYEVTLPNPVKSFAMNIFKTAVTSNEDTSSLTEPSARYNMMNRLDNVKKLKYSWVRADNVVYPYWENEALMIDYVCAIIMFFEVIFFAIGVFAMLLSFILLRVSGFTVTDVIKRKYKKYQENRDARPEKPSKPRRSLKKSKKKKRKAEVEHYE